MPVADGVDADLLHRAVTVRLGWTHPTLRTWYSERDLRDQLSRYLAPEVDRVGDAAFGAALREAVGKEHLAVPGAFANRVLDLADGGWALTGIRFRGMDPDLPFVDVVATSRAPDPEAITALAETVGAAYGELGPSAVRVDVPEPDELVGALGAVEGSGVGGAVDLYVVAGLVTDLRRHPRAPGWSRVGLRPVAPDDAARRASELYERSLATNADLVLWASAEDEESLAACAAEDLLFEVTVDDAPAGLVAARRADDHGLRGFSVQELVLDPDHQGRRSAAGILQRLVDVLPASPSDVLWGTIHPANLPSLRNALSIGRRVVGGYVWVTPAGWAGMRH